MVTIFRRFTVYALLIALFSWGTAASGRSGTRYRRGRPKPAAAKVAEAAAQPNQEAPATSNLAASNPAAPNSAAPNPAASIAKAPVATIAPVSVPSCDEACQQGRQNLAMQSRIGWFCGLLVLVGLCQVVTMIWQGTLVKRTRAEVHQQADSIASQAGSIKVQTDILKTSVAAAQTSADAALKQISHAIALERPWIDVQISQKELSFSRLKIVAKNRGSSPARVVMSTVEKVVLSTGDAGSEPKYGRNGRSDDVQWKLAGDDFLVGEFQLPPDLPDQVRRAGVSVFYQGFIRYNDTLTEDSHETRFCYEAFVQDDGPLRFRLFPAAGYNSMT